MMAETEVSKEVPSLVGIEEKCGLDTSSHQDLPKPECNGINHHNQANDLEKSYVFVSGADGLPGDAVDVKDVVAEGSNVSPKPKAVTVVDQVVELDSQNEQLDAQCVEVSDLSTEELNGNVERSNGDPPVVNDRTWKHESSLENGKGIQLSGADSFEDHTVETETKSLAEAEVKQVEDPDRTSENFTETVVEKVGARNESIEGADGDEQEKFAELTKSDSAPGVVENQESQIGVLDLIAGSGENGESNNISGNANGEYGNQIKLSACETSEACQGSQDVDVGVVQCELQDVSAEAAEDLIKVSSEVEETEEYEVPPSTSLNVDLESNQINSKEETDVVGDVECEMQDVSVKAEDEVKLSGEVVETSEHEVSPSTSLNEDLESNQISSKEETSVVEDVECELQYVSVKAEDQVKLSGEVVETAEHEFPSSTSVELNLESNPINTNEETDMVDDVFKCELQDVSVEAKDEIKLSEKVVETAEHEISPSTSLDLESSPKNTREETDAVEHVCQCELQEMGVKAEDEIKLSGEVVETAEYEIPRSTSLDLDMESNPVNMKEETVMAVKVADCESQDLTVKAENELSGEVETIEHEVPPSTSLDLAMESNPINKKEERNVGVDVVDCAVQDLQVKTTNDEVKLEEVVETSELEVPLSTSLDLGMESYPINTRKETVVVVGVVECESQNACVKGKDEVKLLEEVIETAEHEVPLSASLSLDLELNPINTKEEMDVVKNVVECELQHASVKVEDEANSSGEMVEIAEHVVALEPEGHGHNFSAISSGENSGDVTFTCRKEVSDNFNVNTEGASNVELGIEDVEDAVDQIDGAARSTDENSLLLENGDTGNSPHPNTHVASLGGSSANMIDREEADIKTRRKPFNFLIRVPRFEDESLREQIRLAKLNVDEKTKLRDAIQVQIQDKRANSQIHGIDYEYAKGEARNARKLVRSKRMEIDSLQSLINKAKNALSIEDIDSQIYNMEHMIQHETLPLKEEKQLIREIKQLKQLREQLSSNMGSQDEIKEALEQREEVEERLKIFRKELDILKDRVLKAEAAAVEAEKKYDDENKKVKELQAQFRAADDVRQASYAQWQSLRKELSKKSEHFFKYKDDAAVASKYAFTRDTEAVYRLCMNNVENFMELWNTNDEFRKEYAKFNARSTVRRFGTLDGRSLGPDEEPPILPSYVNERVNRIVSTPVKVDLASQFPTLEVKQEINLENVTSNGKLTKKAKEDKNHKVKGSAIAVQANGSDTVGEDIAYEVHEEPNKTREEIEAIKKAEEIRREEAETKLKEQRRLEALAKANEARERKKRQAEKLQMRAELKTLKEAEQKEKEREKRLRKKERKKAAATDGNSDNNNSEIAPSSESSVETSRDVEVKDVPTAAPKKPKKHWLFGKQGKTKSIPPPLRNRNKKKLQQWMWMGIMSVVILVLFWLGNIGIFSNVNFKRRSPVM